MNAERVHVEFLSYSCCASSCNITTNEIQFVANNNLLHVSTPECHPGGVSF